ncbi:BREX system serine/threonine kinase PglW [Nocardiopsis alborubida]|uniref:BREX system serine/threonine kinase PglW n=1 Tax=Nocardiopsis alborubida TaxID=146802 RepID=A0A7X6MEK6_9ACTN|nr:BREX system serine/threonine kinase PglW [Nocardiopsis alborubida]NKZ00097.1 BREX system serine/threonine kinase PglW [Nocardiopsis alborubida]
MANRWWGKPSEFRWEQSALDHIREYFPDREPYRAWQGMSFTARNNRVRECDLFAVTPTGAFLVEIKSHPGRATNRGSEWTFTNGHRRTITNPLHLTEQKAKELKDRLQWAARKLGLPDNVRIPFIKAAVFLSADDLRCDFDEVQLAEVYGREGLEKQTGLDGIWSGLLGRPHTTVSPGFLKNVSLLMETIGVQSLDRALKLGEYTLEKRSFDSGPTWTDYRARHQQLGSSSRVRLYHYGESPSEDDRRSVERAAKREYMSLEGISHEGIVKAEYFGVVDQIGPGIAFRHHSSWKRLDHFMAEHGDDLEIDTRMEMVRQLAEAVNHAHRNRLFHRALAARSVWVELDGSFPRLYIADWQVASRESLRLRSGGHTRHTSDGGAATEHLEAALGERALAAHVEAAAQAYLAPEFPDYGGRAAPQDIFGLGALTYLVFTGQPPGRNRREMSRQIQEHGCLTPAAVSDDIVPQLDTLVREATRRSPGDRLSTVQAFLRMLDQVEEYLTQPEVKTDPLTARPGDETEQGWRVREVLGRGATARALLMSGPKGVEVVHKVALNSGSAAAALRGEAQTLRIVGSGPRIVALASAGADQETGVREIGERTVLPLQHAGESTLADYLSRQGALGTGELLRFGQHLFDAVEHLESKKVFHRDIKPANLGVQEPPKQGRTLMLFDFSLSRTPCENTAAGTRGYLDPFLGPDRPYDESAERYALAVTLHEMATGELPVWDDDGVGPEFLADDVELPRLSEDAFPEQNRSLLLSFFHRALHRRVERRFATLQDMRSAWEAALYAASPVAEAVVESEETRRRNAESADLNTPLHLAGLTPLALDTATRVLKCETVGDLLTKPVRELHRLRGVSLPTRNELVKAVTDWRKRLDVAEYAVATRSKLPRGADGDEKRKATLDQVIRQFIPTSTEANGQWVRAVRELLGIPEKAAARTGWWPTHRRVAERVGLPQELVDRDLQHAVTYWSKSASLLSSVRDDVVEILARNGRVREVGQIAAELLTLRGTSLEGDARAAYAMAALRVAVECEERRTDQRFVVRRYDRRVLVAQVIDDDPSVPVEGELFDYAEALAHRADELVRVRPGEPLPTPATVRQALRAVTPPEGMEPLSDTDLVQLAAVASGRAEVTPRLELYPVDLDLERALQLTQAVGYLGAPGITPQQVRDRVRARFPALEAPGDGQLWNLLADKYPKLRRREHQGTTYWYLEPELTTYQPSTHTGPHHAPGQLDAASARAWQQLEASVGSGGFRALKTWMPDTERSAEALARTPGVVPFDVSAEFVAVVDEVLGEIGGGLDWDVLAEADNSRPAAFERMLSDVFERLGHRVRSAGPAGPGEDAVVLLYRATPLARYAPGRALLGALVQEAREAGTSPYGLWLLCPMRGPQGPATLDGHPAGIISDVEQVLLPKGFAAPEAAPVG